ncbi:AraC family transcriptional regulator [Bradyrhizobium sp. CCGUVB23]|uniref:helix-turn-helix transcriptional regulator n=1 Tax=Bradyrhizobium sp. CCGUVB23 TaxID=2949630 RepID=UPI0020B3D156|nr:AraC family transcriptional regulator [Bradyrhizobium sp. CCGUVB23]MCP3465934.1 AraC family transcriptional regulator [Bradyrhizobium sp. CCGUVB23]
MSERKSATDPILGPPTRFSFSTDNVAPAHRLNAFRDAVNSVEEVDWLARSPDEFRCAVQADLFDGAIAIDLQASDVRGGPNARQARRNSDRITIQICDRGSLHVEQQASAFDVAPGHAAIVRNDLEGHTTYLDDARVQFLFIDRTLVRPLLKSDWSRSALHISAATPSLRLLRSWLASRADVELSSDQNLRALYVQHTADLVAMILGPHSDAEALLEGRGIKAARLKAVINAIRHNAARQELSAELVGRSLGISERYVRVLLEETGKTFSEHLTEERLLHARRLLNAPHLANHTIAEIAMMSGFSDISHFNRSFRRRFGDTPSGVRRQF